MTSSHQEHSNEGSHHFAHHFESANHEFESCKQGMWLFLLQEVLFFSGLFVAFFIFQALNFESFHEASKYLDWKMGALNTVVLISSSMTMALAVSSSQRGEKQKTVGYLIATLLLASCFLVVKYFEYSHKFHLGILPAGLYLAPSQMIPKVILGFLYLSLGLGWFFSWKAPTGVSPKKKIFWILSAYSALVVFLTWSFLKVDASHFTAITSGPAFELAQAHPKAKLFFSLYYLMTGVHGIHVIGGMVVIAWLISRAEDGEFQGGYFTPVEMVGLYWHFVDLVWIYLFPLLYLVG